MMDERQKRDKVLMIRDLFNSFDHSAQISMLAVLQEGVKPEYDKRTRRRFGSPLVYRCTACSRSELECSINPCRAVVADRA